MEDDHNVVQEEYFSWRAERQKRIRNIIVAVPAILGFALTFLLTVNDSDYPIRFLPFYRNIYSLFNFICFLLSGLGMLMIYLQTGFSKETKRIHDYVQYEKELRDIQNKLKHEKSIDAEELNKLKKEMAELKIAAKQHFSANGALEPAQQEELVAIIKNDLLQKSTDEAIKELLASIESNAKKSNDIEKIYDVFNKTFARLSLEIGALSRRGNLNLSLGILTTIVGLIILGYFVVNIESIPEDKIAFIAYFIPRLSLVILIEIFAYFFLTLYKSSLSEIKYFQNEMTNVEAKLAGIECAILLIDNKNIEPGYALDSPDHYI